MLTIGRKVRVLLSHFVRAQPLLPVAIIFCAGILLARRIELEPLAFLAVFGLGFALFRVNRALALAVLIFSTGGTIYWFRYAPLSETDLRVIIPANETLAVVRGKLCESPQVREFSNGEQSTARLNVLEICIAGQWQKARGEVMTRTKGVLSDDYFAGREVEVSGVLRRPPPAQAPGLFDAREYLHNNLIFFQLNAEKDQDWRTVSSQPIPFLEQARRWAKWQISRGMPDDEALHMLWAMTLGWKTALTGEMAEPFMRTGTLHLFAISGLHVTCIAGLLIFIAQRTGLSRAQSAAIAIPLLWFYTVATGWQSSGVRSAFMSTVLMLGWSLKRPTILMNSLAASALIILVFAPEQLFQAGFQLSFAVVASIALFAPALEKSIARDLPSEPMLPSSLRPRWQQGASWLYYHIRPGLIVSFACFIGSLPLTAYYFNLFTPISLLANLLAVPISSLALLFSMMSLMLVPLAPVLNFLSWAFMWETMEIAKFFEGLGGFYYVAKPDMSFFILYFVLTLGLSRGWFWQQASRTWGLVALAVTAMLFALSNRPTPRLYALASAGTPVYVDLPGKAEDVLIGCSSANHFEFTVERFLRAQGVGALQNLVLPQGDVNHAGGFARALNEFEPRSVFISPHSSRSRPYREALQVLAEAKEVRKVIARGENMAGWNVLHPPGDESFGRAADNAIVLKTAVNGWRVLRLGELGRDGQKSLLNSEADLKADILILSATGLEPIRSDLLDRVSPKVAIISAGKGDRRKTAAGKLFGSAVTQLVLEEDGSVTVEFGREECVIKTMGGAHRVIRKQS